MGELVLIIVIVAAIAYAREDYKKSKAAFRQKQPAPAPGVKRRSALLHHDVGYWSYQVTHLFPAFRHGFATAWLEERQKSAARRAERVRAKTGHLETVAALEPEIAEHRQRQARARERIQAAREPGEAGGEGSPEVSPDEAPAGETTTPPADAPAPTWTQLPPEPPVAAPEPAPEPAAEPAVAASSPSTEGATVAATSADINYRQHHSILTQVRDDAEANVNDVRRQRMQNALEGLAGIVTDSRSLSNAAEIDEKLRQQQKLAEETLDAAERARNDLVKSHGGIQEAVSASPVERAADPGYYQE